MTSGAGVRVFDGPDDGFTDSDFGAIRFASDPGTRAYSPWSRSRLAVNGWIPIQPRMATPDGSARHDLGGMEAMRTETIRAAGAFVHAAVQRYGSTVLCGLTLGFAIVAFWQQAVTGFGTDPGVQLGMGLGVLAGAVWGWRSPRVTGRWSPVADWGYLAASLVLWPLWITALVDGLAWLPASVWQTSLFVTAVGTVLGLLTITIPAALLVRLSQQNVQQPVLLGCATAIGIVIQTIGFGTSTGVFIPALVAIGCCAVHAAYAIRPETPTVKATTAPIGRVTAVSLFTALLSVGIAAGSTQLWLAELWPVTAITSYLSFATMVFGGTLALLVPSRWLTASIASLATAGTALLLFVVSAVSVDWVLWHNATVTTWWQWEAVRAIGFGLVWGPLSACAVWLARTWGLTSSRTVGLCGGIIGCGVVLAIVFVEPAWGLRAGLLMAACGAWLGYGGSTLCIPDSSTSRAWSRIGACAAPIVFCVYQCGVTWDTGRPARLLFSTTALLAHRTGWEPRLLERIDDIRQVSAFAGRSGALTVWANKGGEWHVRENGVPVGAISLTPAWYPQFVPEAAAVFWPLVLVDQPQRVLMLGAGSGSGLRICSAFPIQEVICHEANAPLIDWIRGPLAVASGYDPFVNHCRWVGQPAEWLALPPGDEYDVIVSSPRMPAQQANLICYSAEYYHRAARHLSASGVFCQRFSGVDLGPRPLLSAVKAMQTAFPETACLEVAAGEYLLLGAKIPEALISQNLPARLENRVADVAGVLGWDWSYPLNLPAYDGAALKEAAEELHAPAHSLFQTRFAFHAPVEMMRWAPKLQETAVVLSRPRISAPRFPLPNAAGAPMVLETASRTRKGRYLEWLGAAGENPVILRRLAELAGEQKLVRDFPDTHWWEYRKELREQLQDHPRTKVLPVKHKIESDREWHSEDRRRKMYFETLGELASDEQAEMKTYQALSKVLEPHDPLMTLFGHQELAELLARRDQSPGEERRHRMHAIYYAPGHDVSVRNVVAAIDRAVAFPDPELSPVQRFDELNGLLQTLRGRWEGRNQRPTKAAQVTLQEIERSQLAVERALEAMEPLATAAGYTPTDWANRQDVVERLLLRPFRTYREDLSVRVRESEARAKAKEQAAAAGL